MSEGSVLVAVAHGFLPRAARKDPSNQRSFLSNSDVEVPRQSNVFSKSYCTSIPTKADPLVVAHII